MIPGFDSAQAAYDATEPDNADEEAEEYGDHEEDPDDARDRAYAYGEDD